MISYECCRESLNPKRLVDWYCYKWKFSRDHPDYFKPDGLVSFVGPQGSGKTLSAVDYTENLMRFYPKAKLVSNLMLSNYPIVSFDQWSTKLSEEDRSDLQLLKETLGDKFKRSAIYLQYVRENRIFEFENGDDLAIYNNDEYGVIFLIDEIQLYFNSLQSKNINPEVMAQISQQRKQRKHIVSTSQVFGRMAKPLREQFSSVIVCKNVLGNIQINKLVDRDSIDDHDNGTTMKGTVKKRFVWFHSPKDYGKYDTYHVIKQNKFISEEEKRIGIYGTELSMCR